jgi:hypothetical protein
MPPPGEGEPLTDGEVSLLRAWIDQGARWPDDADPRAAPRTDHWSFQPVRRPPLPDAATDPWVRQPIDAFVLAELRRQGIEPSPEADKATLLRRVWLDLVGLPPPPQEVESYLRDASPDGYERVVERLLASPHYGERFGRHWLDLARYADSDGYEKDLPRPHAWRYRQWVIQAINDDLPFDQFTIEQLAGDLLPGATLEQRVATGFHRNTLINREGGIDPEEDRVKRTVDRTNTTGAVWLGLTVGCAQCHSHKYDPISQREYFGLYAFFNNLDEIDIPAPVTLEGEAQYQAALAQFQRRQAKLQADIDAYIRDQLPAQQAVWEEAFTKSPKGTWQVLTPLSATSSAGATLAILDDGSVLASGTNPDTDTYTLVVETDLRAITALRLEALPDPSLGASGPGRTPHGNFVLSELRVAAEPKLPARGDGTNAAPKESAPERPAVALRNASASFAQGQDGKEFPPEAVIDGKLEKTGWAVAPQFGRRHEAVFETAADLGFEAGTRLVITLQQQFGQQHTLGRFRLAVTTDPRPVRAGGLPDEVRAALATAAPQRTDQQREAITAYYKTIDAGLQKLTAKIAAHQAKQPQRSDASQAQVLTEHSPARPTHLLIRGDFLRPGASVEPGVPEVLPPLPAGDGPPNRLALAQWLVSPDNPLTPRVTVNRAWQTFFGRGLVDTSHDFGTQGSLPSHADLLDWLASELISHGWRLKELHRQIVLSAAYRQTSAARPELLDRDPYNRLLARQNRLRVEAEVVRDLALAASGLLEPRIGGPSVRPPQPGDIASLGYAGSVKWVESTGADRFRRGLYTFFQRTVPYPMFMDFDAPDSNLACTRRERSNTPLAALTLQNDPVFVECAQALARRLIRDVPGHNNPNCDRQGRAKYAFLVTLSRVPSPEEQNVIADLHQQAEDYFEKHPQEAKLLTGSLPRPEAVSDANLAAWTVVARTMLNLDELITRG